MINTLKTTRRLRLQEDEEDSLLAGVDFQSHYLGGEEVFVDDYDIDTVVQSIYSKYSTTDDINNSTLISVTVGTHQLEFFNVSKSELEFRIETPNIKSIHCGGTRPKKYPNAVVLVVCEPEAPSKLHVLHCIDQRKAKKIFETISRAFEYNLPDKRSASKKVQSEISKSAPSPNKVKHNDGKKVNHDGKTEHSLSVNDARKTTDTVQTNGNVSQEPSAAELTRSKQRSKSATQARGVEGLGLLDNVDPEEGFDDEFTSFARSRSTSDTFKIFGR